MSIIAAFVIKYSNVEPSQCFRQIVSPMKADDPRPLIIIIINDISHVVVGWWYGQSFLNNEFVQT